jgi:hypothetical protein
MLLFGPSEFPGTIWSFLVELHLLITWLIGWNFSLGCGIWPNTLVTPALTKNERYNLFGAGVVRVCVVVSLVVHRVLGLFLSFFYWWSSILSFLLVHIFYGGSLGVSYMRAFCTYDIFCHGVFSTSCTYLPCLYVIALKLVDFIIT